MTVSLDGYLEPHRLSFSSPPGSELIAAQGGSDESYPVFSPPPMDENRSGAQNNSLQPPAKQSSRESHRQHRRQSSLNTVSWPDQFDGGTRNRLASSNLDPPDEADDASESPRLRHGHRRESSMGTSWAADTVNPQRRASDISWAIVDDEISARSVPRRRPFSWGPVGEASYRQSLLSTSSRSPVSHHECNYFPPKKHVDEKKAKRLYRDLKRKRACTQIFVLIM
ncbi:uncharacterized protein LOC132261224 [Phlebotomus argentipes]|uniref:uncharacterized protein LOC132261224 n=1 Tax=Phlebotomus argentipes TaxID=94469 RepID=UPI0028933706|nr:uncharacterized protein LOC132261224 [Phlebotomus argentipes]